MRCEDDGPVSEAPRCGASGPFGPPQPPVLNPLWGRDATFPGPPPQADGYRRIRFAVTHGLIVPLPRPAQPPCAGQALEKMFSFYG
jgi:hypothetical protein